MKLHVTTKIYCFKKSSIHIANVQSSIFFVSKIHNPKSVQFLISFCTLLLIFFYSWNKFILHRRSTWSGQKAWAICSYFNPMDMIYPEIILMSQLGHIKQIENSKYYLPRIKINPSRFQMEFLFTSILFLIL